MTFLEHRPFTQKDMLDLQAKTTSSGSTVVLRANSYYLQIYSQLRQLFERNPELVKVHAEAALECAILGMRRALRIHPHEAMPKGGFLHLLGRSSAAKVRVHPAFDNDAFSTFLCILFDSIHNLPALLTTSDVEGYSKSDPAQEVALALSCLQLLAPTKAAVDARFERYFAERVQQIS